MNEYIFTICVDKFGGEISIKAKDYDDARVLLVTYLQRLGYIDNKVIINKFD